MAGEIASLGNRISKTYFGGLAEQRQEEQATKDKDLAYQLAALHALMDHPDTPEGSIPDIIDMQGKLLKAPKEFQQVTQRMREAIQHHGQVPSGPEQETTQSRVNRLAASSASTVPTVDTSSDQPVYHPVTTPGYTPPAPVAPVTTTTPSLAVVPPAPMMFQPTKAYGDMTQGEVKDYRENRSYIQKQQAMLDRQQELANDAGDRATAKQLQGQKDELARIEARNVGRLKVVDETYAQKKKALGGYDSQAAANADKQRLALELDYRGKGMDPDEAKQKAGEVMSANMEAILGQHLARAARDRAEVAHWRSGDIHRDRLDNVVGGPAVGGLSPNEIKQFNVEGGKDLSSSMSKLESELIKQQTLRSNANGSSTGTRQPGQPNYDATYDARIAELQKGVEDHKAAMVTLREQIKGRRVASVPRGPSGATPTLQGAIDAFKSQAKRDPTPDEVNNIKKHYGFQ